ncbi:MAG: DUF599 domain-containing protein [Paracoccaceae bacterium]
MTARDLLTALTWPDALALTALFAAWWLIGWRIEHPGARVSVSVLMADYRREWMQRFVTRNPRVFDASIMGNLRQGTAFFASACMIAIGGGLALVGNPERVADLTRDLALEASARTIELKVLVVLLFLANAFLKFVWAHRLFGYCTILMAAVPNDAEDPLAYHRAGQAADINIAAARSFNRAMRSVYFALAALAWLLGAAALGMAVLATGFVLWRREFASASRRVMLQREAGQGG